MHVKTGMTHQEVVVALLAKADELIAAQRHLPHQHPARKAAEEMSQKLLKAVKLHGRWTDKHG